MHRFAMLACGLIAVLGFTATTQFSATDRFPGTATRVTAEATSVPAVPGASGDSAGWQ